ncbi:MAG: ChuX/HutX family heme-like substrate-binding protein [Bacteroidota bacterium]
MTTRKQQLKKRITQLKEAEPKLRQRDLAHRAGISEAELLSLNLDGHCTQLVGDWKNLLETLRKMGYVMALTRNEHAVHERKGVYDNIKFYGGAHNMGVAVNPDIDLRFFMNEWKYGFAVKMPRGNTTLHSFQFFNARGEAVHKIFSTPKSDIEVYEKISFLFRSPKQSLITDVDISPTVTKKEKADKDIDVKGFQEAWASLEDTHDFFGMLKKYEVSRTQGFRLAPAGYTQQIDNEAVVRTLSLAAEKKVSIMCFLHSKGCIQIHTGPVKNLKFFGDWYNVMDPKFNLHLKMSSIAQTWVVKKPTTDGIVTSLELFDANGELITYFFGARKPGKPELEDWRAVIKEVQAYTKVTR